MSDGLTIEELDVLRLFLSQRDVHCPRCEYNLRGLLTTRCPECAQRLDILLPAARAALGRPRPEPTSDAPREPLPPLPKLEVVEVSRFEQWTRRALPRLVAVGLTCAGLAVVLGGAALGAMWLNLTSKRDHRLLLVAGCGAIASAAASFIVVRTMSHDVSFREPMWHRWVRLVMAWVWLPITAACAAWQW